MKRVASICILAALNSVLITALAWTSLGGAPEPQWLANETPVTAAMKPQPVPQLVQLPLKDRETAWQHPLFSPDRQADLDKATPGAQPVNGIHLTGVVIDGQTRWALLRLPNRQNVKLKQGEALDGGCVLRQVDASSAAFQCQGQANILDLPVPRLPAPSAALPMTLPPVRHHD